MPTSFKLERLAIHYVDRKIDQLRFADGEQDLSALDVTITSFFIELLAKVWNALEQGSTSSARFANQSVTQQQVTNVLAGKTDFFEASKELAKHLYHKTPKTASPGLLATIRFTNQSGCSYIGLLKIRYKDESFVRALGSALTQLRVEHVQNMLFKEIQKGAISPHPSKRGYDMKIIDEQIDEAPKYFKEFLGCKAKPSDAHQTKKLLPCIVQYGEKRELHTKRQKFSHLITSLLEKDVDINSENLTEAIQQQNIFGTKFDPDDFKRFIQQESDIGEIDIPIDEFRYRGTTDRSIRKIKATFTDPTLAGLTISGSSEVFGRIMKADGDKYIFHIETTKEGYKEEYD